MSLGRVFGLAVTATPSALVAYMALWCGLALVVQRRLRLAFGSALAVSGVATGLHVLGILVHHFGHALAA